MSRRFAIYYAPERGSLLEERAAGWLVRTDLREVTVSARRYGFHATLKAPMELRGERTAFEAALIDFAQRHAPVPAGRLAPVLLDGFLALACDQQPDELTAFARTVVEAFEPWRAPLTAAERARRLSAPLTPRQVALIDTYGYPFVLEQFQFHMTLTDRLPREQQAPLRAAAEEWFAEALAAPVAIDRIVLFAEDKPGDGFVRLDDYVLAGTTQ